MPICSLDDLAFFVNRDGHRLLPGTTWFAGFRHRRPEPLRNWLLWRVQEVAGTLCLVALLEPTYAVPVTAELALAVADINLADAFSYERCPAFYEIAQVLGYELWASEDAGMGLIALNLRNWDGDVWASLKASSYTELSPAVIAAKLEDLFEQLSVKAAELKRHKAYQQRQRITYKAGAGWERAFIR